MRRSLLVNDRDMHTFLRLLLVAGIVSCVTGARTAYAAISFDGGGGTKWWFDPVNWNTNGKAIVDVVLPGIRSEPA